MRKVLIFLISFICTGGVLAQGYNNPTVEQIASCGLPVLLVTTVNGEEPTCDVVYAPEGEDGISITNVTKVPGRLEIIKGGTTVFDSGDYQEDVSGITFRIRGNTSAIGLKKPYKIKLQKKADLLFRGDDRYKDKEWVLLKTFDIYNPIGYKLNEIMGMQWAPASEMVNLFVNGDYRGLYTLTETIKRNTDARIDVEKDGGYIFECDPYWWNEPVYFKSNSGKPFTFKYPSDEDITEEQLEYMRTYINNVEASIADGTYGQYIDVESFALWLLGIDIMGNSDAAGANIFMTKYDSTDESLLKMANFWDFDVMAKMPYNQWSVVHTRYFYFQDLLTSPCSDFVDTYKQLWAERGASIRAELLDFINNFPSTDTGKGFDASFPYEKARWDYDDPDTSQSQADTFHDYFVNRLNWLDQNIPMIVSGIKDITTAEPAEVATYNILGQKVDPNARGGIFIVNGKKIFKP